MPSFGSDGVTNGLLRELDFFCLYSWEGQIESEMLFVATIVI